MPPISSKGGSATFSAIAIPDVTSITAPRTVEGLAYASSDTAGETSHVAGNGNRTVSITALYQTGGAYPSPGTTAALVANYASGDAAFTGDALCTSATPTIAPGSGAIIEVTFEFVQVI